MTGDAATVRAGRETYLAARVLDALVREDYGGLSGRVSGEVLALPGGRVVRLTREPSGAGRYPGFLADLVVDDVLTLDEVLAAVRALADPRDDVTAFERECREALRSLRLYDAVTPRPHGIARYEALAATVDHPVYPTARCRLGVDERDLLAYAPEFGPSFRLCWTTVPHSTCRGDRPAWWPTAADLGMPGDLDVFPVHPLAARLMPTVTGPAVTVRPTLSMRTVVVGTDEQLKLPLPTSTLGLRNRRVIMPATLADGALVERVLRAVLAREGSPVLLADEQTWGHADDPLRGYLLRRMPAEGVPVAALLARTEKGGHVIEELTDDVPSFFGSYLGALFDWNVMLLTKYGIALEAHQQNVSVVPGEPLRLMIKDNDGALLDLRRLRETLRWAPEPAEFGDRRLLTSDPEALARVFTTITVHLCAGAIAFGLAERGLLPLATGLGLIRDHLGAALDAHDGSGFLRARTLEADRLPGKAMVTAGTLVGKDRTRAEDINKHYGPPGPNYLKRSAH
ncbi:IucA/IucC family protein [Actinoallomurus bryophytorum]|uniref:Siderophore synthetase component n=1 Tax=Actinoallomurus bryophytorum TaxID=1490222 RepID=A0A543CEV0_9ACTN|nr:IucA/IucC family protein [Actinoallomurus bryophytorum]TQL95624.1 siderophore synthetase component [Actinoallomurus bryophytorum]